MTLIEFFEYLARSEATRELAHNLADAWAESEGAPDAIASAA